MTSASPRVSSISKTMFPRKVSSIAFGIGGLASFVILASLLLFSHPMGSSVTGYFYGSETTQNVQFHYSTELDQNPSPDSSLDSKPLIQDSDNKLLPKESEDSSEPNDSSEPKDSPEPKDSSEPKDSPTSGDSSESKDSLEPVDVRLGKETNSSKSSNISMDEEATQDAVVSECDLYHGNWFYDPMGPSYTNNSCPLLTQMQNCQGNGRPDKGYENWRWKPSQCDLPRFDAKKFLELMKGKTLAFIGDSVARNQMESMMCLLWQVETPVNRGNRKMQRWHFKSSSVMIARIWSSWLVHQFNEPFDFAPEGVTKLKLDQPDERIIEALPKFDVVVLSSGHWFAKQSVYILNDEIVGGQLWWPDKSKPQKVNNVEAFGISSETILKAIANHPNFTGLTILRTWSPDHYEGGAWNTGGSCTGKEEPLPPGKLVKNGFTEIMHEKQTTGFQRAGADDKLGNKSKKLKLMDITEAFGYRHDGHPGPYRSPDPNKKTKRGPDGQPPPQDCLHWCMPGPVDTWNEMVLEIVRRDFEGSQSKPSS